jgi:hypothetical protein
MLLRFKGPFVGINQAVDSGYLDKSEAEDCRNLDLSSGTLRKRSGWSEAADFSAYGKILGMYQYEQNDGTLIRFIHAGAKLFKWDPLTGTQTELGSNVMNASEPSEFFTVNNRVFFGTLSGFKVTDGTSVFAVNIAAPTSGPTVAAEAHAGTEIPKLGTYDYKITFYSTTWGLESPASPASSPVTTTAANGRIQLSSLPSAVPGGGDTRVDQKRIYRRKVSASESVWTRIADVSLATTDYEDAISDNDVDVTRIAPPSANLAPSSVKHMAFQGGVFFFTDATNPTRLYYTLAAQPWVVAGSLEIGSSGDSDPITGIAAFQGQVIVFKQRSTWTLSGNSPATFFQRRIHSAVGCVSDRAIVEVDDTLYFPSQNSIYSYDGANFVDIGKKLKTSYLGREFSRDRFMIGEHDLELGAIIFQWTPGGGSANTDGATFFYRHSMSVGSASWCPWGFGATGMSSITRFKDPTTQLVEVFYGFESGSLGAAGGFSDDLLPIEYYWTGPRFDAEFPERWKRWGELFVDFNRQAVDSLVEIHFAKEEITAPAIWKTHNMVDGVFRSRLAHSSRTLQLKLRGNSQAPAEIVSWAVRAEVAGRF